MGSDSVKNLFKIYQNNALESPEQGLTRSEFKNALEEFRSFQSQNSLKNSESNFLYINDRLYGDRLFDLLDENNDGSISQREFILGLGCKLCAGSVNQKIECNPLFFSSFLPPPSLFPFPFPFLPLTASSFLSHPPFSLSPSFPHCFFFPSSLLSPILCLLHPLATILSFPTACFLHCRKMSESMFCIVSPGLSSSFFLLFQFCN